MIETTTTRRSPALWIIVALLVAGIAVIVIVNNYNAHQRQLCNETNQVITNANAEGVDDALRDDGYANPLQPSDCG